MTDCDAAARRAFDALSAGLPRARVGVVGDVMVDQFLYGAVERISPEAPVPVVEVEREVFLLGGAANVVHNLAALGARVELFGVVGEDPLAELLREELGRLGVTGTGLVAVPDRPTAIKTRVIAQHQQVVRFDRERRTPVSRAVIGRLVAGLGSRLDRLDAVVVSDYGKGVVGPELMTPLLRRARECGVAVAVDPKPANAGSYRGAAVLTPNVKETEAMTGLPARSDEEVAAAGRRLLETLEARTVLVTRGDRGMALLREGEAETMYIPTRARDVFDVTGAGDTTVAVFVLARAAGADLEGAACLANLAAGVVVGKLGTAVVTAEELAHAVGHGIGAGHRASPVAR